MKVNMYRDSPGLVVLNRGNLIADRLIEHILEDTVVQLDQFIAIMLLIMHGNTKLDVARALQSYLPQEKIQLTVG